MRLKLNYIIVSYGLVSFPGSLRKRKPAWDYGVMGLQPDLTR